MVQNVCKLRPFSECYLDLGVNQISSKQRSCKLHLEKGNIVVIILVRTFCLKSI